MRDVERQDTADRLDDPDRLDNVDRVDTPDRLDNVDRQETLTTEPIPAGSRDAEPLPATPSPADPFVTEPGTAEPLPVDESGLEPGDAEVPEQRPDQDTVHDSAHDTDTEVFSGEAVTRLRARWRELQADFVDDPQRAVQEADGVLDEVLRTITEHRERLAGEWQGHTDTEDLRLAMRGYRSFFDRLLPMT